MLELTIARLHRKIRAVKRNELDQTDLRCAPDNPVLEAEQVRTISIFVFKTPL
jgi:DNA-binding GntR family transcriptional regulator